MAHAPANALYRSLTSLPRGMAQSNATGCAFIVSPVLTKRGGGGLSQPLYTRFRETNGCGAAYKHIKQPIFLGCAV